MRLPFILLFLSLGVGAEEIFVETFDVLETDLTAWISDTESNGDETDWTQVLPTGWVANNEGVPDGGVEEFAGWTFLDPVSWNATAGQGRDSFSKGTGIVAVADGDEWDDSGPGARMETVLSTPPIALVSSQTNSVALRFDSSWNAEPQVGLVHVSFDEGDPIEVLRYDDTTPTMINETVFLPIDNPEGATSMMVSFTYEAGNNWWWAIDNIVVTSNEIVVLSQPDSVEALIGDQASFSVAAHGGVLSYQWQKDGEPIAGATSATLSLAEVSSADAGLYRVEISGVGLETVTSDEVVLAVQGLDNSKILYSENFDSLPLGPNVDEGLAAPNVWTETGPAGWFVDDSGVPGIDSEDADGDGIPDLDGVTEWAGWSFADRLWWAQTAGDQRRSEFTRACGAILISDSDEWDDLPHPPFTAEERLDNVATTGDIDLQGAAANTVKLRFDSSWRPYDMSLGVIEASYDGAEPIEVSRFESGASSEFYRPDSTNELVTVSLNNPEGASSVKLTFKLLNAGNDWWWGLDNLLMYTGAAPPAILSNPEDLQVSGGEVARISVEVDTENTVGAVSYQWYRRTDGDRQMIAGATSGMLELPSAVVADTGFYSVDVSNQVGTLTSCEAQLVVGPLLITAQPVSLRVSAGDEACFFAVPEGADPFGFQWYRGSGADRVAIDGAANPSATTFELVILSATSEDTGIYSVDISNDFGVVMSQEVSLEVVPLLIVDEPTPSTLRAGEDAMFSVVIDAEEPITYEWFFRPLGSEEAAMIAGEDDFRLQIAGTTIADAGFYQVKATNAFGEVYSSEAKLNVQPLPGLALVYAEDFEGLALGSNVDEAVEGDEVWTNVPPEGWSIDNSMMAGQDSEDADGDGFPDLDGVTEWAGWGFADIDWWVAAAGDQRRSEFSGGQGTVLIADPDEWDDLAHSPGTFNTVLTTAEIPLGPVEPGSAVLQFDSSWRPYANQTAVVTAAFDGGAPFEVARFESDEDSPDFRPDEIFINESYTAALTNPEGAESVVLTFSLTDAGNDWWWAIDNIRITGDVPGLVFTVKSIVRDVENRAVTLLWDSFPGDRYAIETSLDLITWDPGLDDILSQGLETQIETAPLPGELTQIYFRVRRE